MYDWSPDMGQRDGRGVLYMVWGDRCEQELARSLESARLFGLPTHVVRGDSNASLVQKSAMYHQSPFAQTLFLDSDTVLLDDPSYGFEMAARHGLCVVIAPAGNAAIHWHLDDAPVDLVQYNTGVIFFSKRPPVEQLFETWRRRSDPGQRNDQPGFALAVHETGFNPFVLPLMWNYRAAYGQGPIFGPIKIWHSRQPLPDNIQSYNPQSRGFAKLCRRWWPRRGSFIKSR